MCSDYSVTYVPGSDHILYPGLTAGAIALAALRALLPYEHSFVTLCINEFKKSPCEPQNIEVPAALASLLRFDIPCSIF